jgi:predicted HTH transcriptional regulator
MGTGINKMNELCIQHNIPKPEYTFDKFFTVTFKRLSLNQNGELNKGQLAVYNLIYSKSGINATDISKKLQMPFRHCKTITTLNFKHLFFYNALVQSINIFVF